MVSLASGLYESVASEQISPPLAIYLVVVAFSAVAVTQVGLRFLVFLLDFRHKLLLFIWMAAYQGSWLQKFVEWISAHVQERFPNRSLFDRRELSEWDEEG